MIVKIALCALCVCVLSSMLRQYSKSFVIFIEIAFVGIVFSLIIGDAIRSFSSLIDLYSYDTAQSKVIKCLIKGAVICVLTKISCDVCHESGNVMVGDIVELSGRVILIIISLPFLESVVKTAISFAS